MKGICVRDHILDWHRLWDDYIRKETREESTSNKKGRCDRNLALFIKAKKGKGKAFTKKGNNDEEG